MNLCGEALLHSGKEHQGEKMYKDEKSVLLELLKIKICAILYSVYIYSKSAFSCNGSIAGLRIANMPPYYARFSQFAIRKGNPTLQHYDAILFDVDGTLIDSAPGILNTLEEVFHDMGVTVTRNELLRYIGPPLRKTFGEYFSDPAKIEEATERYRVSYEAKGSHEGDAYPGVPEMLRRLKDAGLTLGTATCKPTHVVTPILEEQGLASYFDFIGGASMDETRDTKTDVIRHVLEQSVMQGKRVLMVGDRQDDMVGAANCGLDVAAAMYGYGSQEELAPFAPVFAAESCTALADWLLGPDEP